MVSEKNILKKVYRILKNGELIRYILSGKAGRALSIWMEKMHLTCFTPRFIKACFMFLRIKAKRIQAYGFKDLQAGSSSYDGEITGIKNYEDNITRAIEAYFRGKEEQVSQPGSYQIKGMWEPILENFHRELTSALKHKNITAVRSILENFGRDKVSNGLSLSADIPGNMREKLEYINSFNLRQYCWNKLVGYGESPSPYEKRIGNLSGIEKNGRLILKSSFRLSYYASRINGLMSSTGGKVLVEIGGGYGGVPYHLFRENDRKMTYVDLDIPEICLIASYFLMNNFPEKSFLLYGEKDIKDVVLEDFDIVIMPNYELKSLSDMSSDLVFNSHSLIEMDPATVKEYLSQINRISRKHFLHFNYEHLPGSTYTTSNGDVKEHISINMPEFEGLLSDFNKIYRFPELFAAVDLDFLDISYFECLFSRTGGDVA